MLRQSVGDGVSCVIFANRSAASFVAAGALVGVWLRCLCGCSCGCGFARRVAEQSAKCTRFNAYADSIANHCPKRSQGNGIAAADSNADTDVRPHRNEHKHDQGTQPEKDNRHQHIRWHDDVIRNALVE